MAVVNWLNPINTTTFTDVLTELKDRDESIGKMIFDASDTNRPTDFMRFNRATVAFENWNGSSWDQIFGFADIDHDQLLNFVADEHFDKTQAQTISGRFDFSGGFDFSGITEFRATAGGIIADTSPGSDTKSFTVGGGGGFGGGEGGFLHVSGNEHIGEPGFARLQCGNVSGAKLELKTTGSQNIDQIVNNRLDLQLLSDHRIKYAPFTTRFNDEGKYQSCAVAEITSTGFINILFESLQDGAAWFLEIWAVGRRESAASDLVTYFKKICIVRRFNAGAPVVVDIETERDVVIGASDLDFEFDTTATQWRFRARLGVGVGTYSMIAYATWIQIEAVN